MFMLHHVPNNSPQDRSVLGSLLEVESIVKCVPNVAGNINANHQRWQNLWAVAAQRQLDEKFFLMAVAVGGHVAQADDVNMT